MNTKELVLGIRTNRNFEELQAYFSSHPKKLDELVELVINQEAYPISEYGSWILLHHSKYYPEQLRRYYNAFVDLVFNSKNQSVLRNVVNIIQRLGICEYRESELIDRLISFIRDAENKVALHVYSIYVLAQFVQKYPELKSEIQEVIALNNIEKSAAYKIAMRNFDKLT